MQPCPAWIQRARRGCKADLPWQRVALAGLGDGAPLALEAVQAEAAFGGA